MTRCWQDGLSLLPALTQRWRLYAPDFRGNGKSARTRGYSVLDYARDTLQFLRSVVGAPAILYGHSLGAMIAPWVAAQAPDLMSGIVMEDPPFGTMGPCIAQTPYAGYFRDQLPLAGSDRPLPEVAAALGNIMFRWQDRCGWDPSRVAGGRSDGR